MSEQNNQEDRVKMLKTIDQYWAGYKSLMVPKDAPKALVEIARMSFYGGAMVTHTAVFDAMEYLSEDDATAYINQFATDLNNAFEEIQARGLALMQSRKQAKH